MNRSLLRSACTASLWLGSIAPVISADAPSGGLAQEELSAARTAVGELGKSLKQQLQAAISAEGPAEAVQVCKTIAPAVAEQVSSDKGLSIKRTALKVRNPANAPDDYERKVLLRFVEEAASGADLSKLEHMEIVTEGGAQRLRYMKAIPMAADPCQTCHGTNIAPNVQERIHSLYPSDQAIGFEPGTLRGAFSVSAPLK